VSLLTISTQADKVISLERYRSKLSGEISLFFPVICPHTDVSTAA